MLVDLSRPKKLIDVIDRGFEQLVLPESQAGFWAAFIYGAIIFVAVVVVGYEVAEQTIRMAAKYANDLTGIAFVDNIAKYIIKSVGGEVKHFVVSLSIHTATAIFPIVSTTFFIATLQDSLIKKIEIRWYGRGDAELVSTLRVSISLLFGGIVYAFLTAVGWILSMGPILPVPFPLLGAAVSAYAGVGYMSRCYFDTVALRRLSMKHVADLRRKNRFKILFIGLILYGMFSIPGVNLLAAIVGTAMMVHLQWWLCGEGAVEGSHQSGTLSRMLPPPPPLPKVTSNWVPPQLPSASPPPTPNWTPPPLPGAP